MKKIFKICMISALLGITASCSGPGYTQQQAKHILAYIPIDESEEIECYMSYYQDGIHTQYPLVFKKGARETFIKDFNDFNVEYRKKWLENWNNLYNYKGLPVVGYPIGNEFYRFVCERKGQKVQSFQVYNRAELDTFSHVSIDIKKYFTEESWKNHGRIFSKDFLKMCPNHNVINHTRMQRYSKRSEPIRSF